MSSLSSSLSSIIPTLTNILLPVLVVVIMISVVMMIWKRNTSGALTTGFLGIGLILFIMFSPSLFSSILDEKDPKKSTPAPTKPPEVVETPKATPSPDVQAPPADLTGLWTTLIVIGSVLLIGLLSVLLFTAIKRARHNALELKAKQEAAAAEKAKALAVWAKSTDKHQWLKDKVIEIETDWDMLFSYPALVDPSVPQTREFHRALKAVDAASSEPPADLNLSMDIGALPYPKLVAHADETWEAAWRFAKHTGTKLIPKEERKKVDQIIKLLKIARDGGGSENERSVAYERASKLIGELQFVKIPDAARKAIGVEARLMIEGPIHSVDSNKTEQAEKAFAL